MVLRRARGRRRPWLRWALLVVLLAALVAGGTVLARRVTDSPERARREYAAALAKGDARALRALSAQPLDGVVTGRALGESERIADARVTADGIGFTLGGEPHEVVVPVGQVDGRWTVTTAAATVSLAGLPALVSVDGAVVADRDTVTLVPGRHHVRSADPLLDLAFDVDVVDPAVAPELPDPAVELSESGLAGARAAAAASLGSCLGRAEAAPDGCPQQVTDPPGLRLVAGTERWSLAGADPTSALEVVLEPGKPWGRSEQLTLPLRLEADAVRRTDGTATRYAQDVEVPARVLVSVAGGRASVGWTR